MIETYFRNENEGEDRPTVSINRNEYIFDTIVWLLANHLIFNLLSHPHTRTRPLNRLTLPLELITNFNHLYFIGF